MIKANRRAEAGDIAEHSRHSFSMRRKELSGGNFKLELVADICLPPAAIATTYHYIVEKYIQRVESC